MKKLLPVLLCCLPLLAQPQVSGIALGPSVSMGVPLKKTFLQNIQEREYTPLLCAGLRVEMAIDAQFSFVTGLGLRALRAVDTYQWITPSGQTIDPALPASSTYRVTYAEMPFFFNMYFPAEKKWQVSCSLGSIGSVKTAEQRTLTMMDGSTRAGLGGGGFTAVTFTFRTSVGLRWNLSQTYGMQLEPLAQYVFYPWNDMQQKGIFEYGASLSLVYRL